MSSEMVAHTADYRQWQEFWRSTAIGQQAVAPFAQQLVAQMPSEKLTERVRGGMDYEC